MKKRLNKIFGIFRKERDFVKNKNIFLIAFAVVFSAIIGVIVVFFDFKFNDTKTTIEIPCNQNVESSELEQIKKIATDNLETECFVQKSTTSDEVSLEKIDKLTIGCYSNFTKDDAEFQNKIKNLTNELQNNFKDKILLKNKEEILITNLETSYINQVNDFSLAVLAAVVLVIPTLFFIIAFRKINGFSVALSFLVLLIFNVAFFVAVVFLLSNILNFYCFEKFVLPLCVIAVNFLINSTMAFSKLQNKLLSKKEQKPQLKDAINEVINSMKSDFIINFIIFSAIPCIFASAFKLFGFFVFDEFIYFKSFVFVFATYFVSSLVLLLTSIFVLLQFFSILKKTKKNKLLSKKEQQPKLKQIIN